MGHQESTAGWSDGYSKIIKVWKIKLNLTRVKTHILKYFNRSNRINAIETTHLTSTGVEDFRLVEGALASAICSQEIKRDSYTKLTQPNATDKFRLSAKNLLPWFSNAVTKFDEPTLSRVTYQQDRQIIYAQNRAKSALATWAALSLSREFDIRDRACGLMWSVVGSHKWKVKNKKLGVSP